MDQVQNEETQVIPETISEEKPEERPERRRRRQSAPKFRFRVPEFLTRIGEDVQHSPPSGREDTKSEEGRTGSTQRGLRGMSRTTR